MSVWNDGGPAFPGEGSGMTLRDYFAAKIAQGAAVNLHGVIDLPDEDILLIASQCYRLSDAMLEARDAAVQYGAVSL